MFAIIREINELNELKYIIDKLAETFARIRF